MHAYRNDRVCTNNLLIVRSVLERSPGPAAGKEESRDP
jgi:hypothetical protein